MDLNFYYDEAELEMETAIEQYESNLSKVTTGQANPKIFEMIKVNYFDEYVPINQLSAISIPEPRQLLIKPFDNSITKDIVSAINQANIGLTPQNEGDKIRINLPELSTQRRQELVKQTAKYNEEAKIKIRNIRQKTNKAIKADKTLSEDQGLDFLEQIQNLTNKYVNQIDTIGDSKAKELVEI